MYFFLYILSFIAHAHYMDTLKEKALERGVPTEEFSKITKDIKLRDDVIYNDRHQPECVFTFSHYKAKRLTPALIQKAIKKALHHKKLLKHLEKKYRVPSSIIASLWALETSCGSFIGHIPVLDSLYTLAYDGRRRALFEEQFLTAITLIHKEPSLQSLFRKGSWAGAFGQCQFMPTTYAQFAVDEDQDGIKDTVHSLSDALGSIANFLQKNGWDPAYKWGRALPNITVDDIYCATAPAPLTYWKERIPCLPVTHPNLSGFFIKPDKNGEVFIVYSPNFEVLKKWNRSNNFALCVGLLSDKLRKVLS